jgi:hypothetical protein
MKQSVKQVILRPDKETVLSGLVFILLGQGKYLPGQA